jgi:uncharacterized membrane protein (UPF0136 family)
MSIETIAAIAYGLLALIGGIIAYKKVNSKMSLISGTISGVLLLIAGVMQWQGLPLGLLFAKIITALLVVVFGIRLFKTRKFMPAGLMLLAGLVTFGVMVAGSII